EPGPRHLDAHERAEHLARPDRLRRGVLAVPKPALSHERRGRAAVAFALHVSRAVSRAFPAAPVRGIARPFRRGRHLAVLARGGLAFLPDRFHRGGLSEFAWPQGVSRGAYAALAGVCRPVAARGAAM